MIRFLSISRLTTAFTLSLLIFARLGIWWLGSPDTTAVREFKAVPAIAAIQQLSELAAIHKHIITTIEGENRHHKGKWHLEGDVILGVDLSKAYYVATDPVARTSILRLPQPHLVSHKVDHDRSFEVSLNSKTWIPLSSQKSMRDDVWAAADRKIQKIGQVPENLIEVKAQAQTVLKNLFDGAGWAITLQWQPAPTEDAAATAAMP
jgi:hypothetical protein